MTDAPRPRRGTGLTTTQRRTLHQIARGLTAQQIAGEDSVTIFGARSRVETLRRVLGARTRAEVLLISIRDGHATVDELLNAQPTAVPETAPRDSKIPKPGGCGYCGIGQREHARQWVDGVGWHGWSAPTEQQRRERMQARRTARAEGQRVIAERLAGEAGR